MIRVGRDEETFGERGKKTSFSISNTIEQYIYSVLVAMPQLAWIKLQFSRFLVDINICCVDVLRFSAFSFSETVFQHSCINRLKLQFSLRLCRSFQEVEHFFSLQKNLSINPNIAQDAWVFDGGLITYAFHF